jgi:hypothetical protein
MKWCLHVSNNQIKGPGKHLLCNKIIVSVPVVNFFLTLNHVTKQTWENLYATTVPEDALYILEQHNYEPVEEESW